MILIGAKCKLKSKMSKMLVGVQYCREKVLSFWWWKCNLSAPEKLYSFIIINSFSIILCCKPFFKYIQHTKANAMIRIILGCGITYNCLRRYERNFDCMSSGLYHVRFITSYCCCYVKNISVLFENFNYFNNYANRTENVKRRS